MYLFFNHFKSNWMQKQIEPLRTLEHRPRHIHAILAGKQVWQLHRHGDRTVSGVNAILLQHIGNACVGAGGIKGHVFYGRDPPFTDRYCMLNLRQYRTMSRKGIRQPSRELCGITLGCIWKRKRRQHERIFRQFKEGSRRFSGAKSRLSDAEMAEKTPWWSLREFFRYALECIRKFSETPSRQIAIRRRKIRSCRRLFLFQIRPEKRIRFLLSFRYHTANEIFKSAYFQGFAALAFTFCSFPFVLEMHYLNSFA